MNHRQMVLDVMERGSIRESRLGRSSEIIGFRTEFETGELFSRPRMNRKLGWVEGLQMLSGNFYPSDFRLAAPKLVWDYTWETGYGSKAGDQIYLAIEQLKKLPTTRHAIVFIDNPGFAGQHLRPCISSYQFMLVDGKLDTVISARSWDLVMGFIYDTMVASMVSLTMASILGLTTGKTIGMAATGHVYHKDFDEGRVPAEDPIAHRKMVITEPFKSWEEVQQYANIELAIFRADPEHYSRPARFGIEAL